MGAMHFREVRRIEERSLPEPNSGCWLWLGSLDADGYGSVKHRGRKERAHRYSFLAHGGSLAAGPCVLHSCHNAACVNPDHLRSGTNDDNASDRTKLGRHRAAHVARSPLSAADVLQIRAMCAAGVMQKEIGERFGIASSAVSAIIAAIDAKGRKACPDVYSLNLNERVTVTLTKEGADVLNAEQPLADVRRAGDEYATQLWMLMRTFGEHMHLCGPTMFYPLSIAIQAKKLEER